MELSMNMYSLIARLGPAALLAAALAGCNTAPRGDTGGIIDPKERTGADRFDERADTVTLFEFAEDVGQNLAGEFLSVPAIQGSQYRVVIEIGSIQNNTRTPASDFAAVQRRVFITLAQSDLVRKGAKVVESRARVERDAGAAGQATVVRDPLGRERPTSSGGMTDYPLGDTYFLQGTFSELSRGAGRQSTYQFDFTLTNAQSREIVYAKQILAKQFR